MVYFPVITSHVLVIFRLSITYKGEIINVAAEIFLSLLLLLLLRNNPLYYMEKLHVAGLISMLYAPFPALFMNPNY